MSFARNLRRFIQALSGGLRAVLATLFATLSYYGRRRLQAARSDISTENDSDSTGTTDTTGSGSSSNSSSNSSGYETAYGGGRGRGRYRSMQRAAMLRRSFRHLANAGALSGRGADMISVAPLCNLRLGRLRFLHYRVGRRGAAFLASRRAEAARRGKRLVLRESELDLGSGRRACDFGRPYNFDSGSSDSGSDWS